MYTLDFSHVFTVIGIGFHLYPNTVNVYISVLITYRHTIRYYNCTEKGVETDDIKLLTDVCNRLVLYFRQVKYVYTTFKKTIW